MIGTTNLLQNGPQEGQCNYFVVRKKRFCRMSVRPGRQYCGEHEPKPKTDDGQDDIRIPCPLDPKHTCYASKLEKHLSICNAKKTEAPSYIIHNINAPSIEDSSPRTPLNEVPTEFLEKVVEKINSLFAEHISEHVTTFSPPSIHSSVCEEFAEPRRGEASRKHLRQVSSLLHIAEEEGLVQDGTCYVELGAGKGQLSYYLGVSWCRGNNSRVLSIDRAALRHKRDNLLRSERLKQAARESNGDLNATGEVLEENMEVGAVRIRADLAHLALERVPVVKECERVVGFAKHLCGVAMDYALRCVRAARAHVRGAALATCCHHRCARDVYVGAGALQNLGVTPADFKVILSIVSWATCGDGRSRDLRRSNQQREQNNQSEATDNTGSTDETNEESSEKLQRVENVQISNGMNLKDHTQSVPSADKNHVQISNSLNLKDHTVRAEVGRRAKLLLDWGRVLYLRQLGFDARLCYYVPTAVSLENVCIVVKKAS